MDRYYIDYVYFVNGNENEGMESERFYFDTLKEAIVKLKTLQDCYLFHATLYKNNNKEIGNELAFITETREEFYNKRVENLFYK